MNETLAPTMVEHVNKHVILWFQKSNQYIVSTSSTYKVIATFLSAEDSHHFKQLVLKSGFTNEQANQFLTEIPNFLEDCNKPVENSQPDPVEFEGNQRNISCEYDIDTFRLLVHYDSDELKQLIHPPLEHLEVLKLNSDCIFDIFEKGNKIYFFRNENFVCSWVKKEYHLFQGKFIISLLCSLHNNEEDDWIGTFHASAVTKSNKTAMIIGDSGMGKSTFTALLLGNGYEILSDDIVPILAKDSCLYPYPGGISIKQGAFDVLKSKLPKFEKLREHYINPYKGYVKYLNAPKSKGYLVGYPCSVIVLIEYKKNSKTIIKNISIADALEILIPQSWISPKVSNAKKFMNWLKTISFYKLTYSNSDEAIREFEQLMND